MRLCFSSTYNDYQIICEGNEIVQVFSSSVVRVSIQ